MDRALLKQNAKNSFKKKWFESAVVALIMGVFQGAMPIIGYVGTNSLYKYLDTGI